MVRLAGTLTVLRSLTLTPVRVPFMTCPYGRTGSGLSSYSHYEASGARYIYWVLEGRGLVAEPSMTFLPCH
jgi:hypothetical protein